MLAREVLVVVVVVVVVVKAALRIAVPDSPETGKLGYLAKERGGVN